MVEQQDVQHGSDPVADGAGSVGTAEPSLQGLAQCVTNEVEKLLDTYGVPVPQQREYLEMAERAAERGWWQAYGSALTDATQTQIALEEDATTITNFEPVVVPGLLQTAAYARAVISTAVLDITPRQVETRVAARMARQAILTKPDPPQLITILDEAVLHREVGGRAVMTRQLRQLIEIATTQPNVTVLVIPFTAGAHAASEGPFAVIEFGVEPGAVLLEGKTADLFLEEDDEIAAYQDAASILQQSALDADDFGHPDRAGAQGDDMNRDTRPGLGVGLASAGWRKSSRSSGGANCVEINLTQLDLVHIRDSKDRGSGPTITVTPRQWATLIDQIAITTP